MCICKASETGDPPAGWGVQAKRGQIPRNEAYVKVRRRASVPEGQGMRGTLSFDPAQDREFVERLAERQMGRFPTAS
jgi:hypothetical protein